MTPQNHESYLFTCRPSDLIVHVTMLLFTSCSTCAFLQDMKYENKMTIRNFSISLWTLFSKCVFTYIYKKKKKAIPIHSFAATKNVMNKITWICTACHAIGGWSYLCALRVGVGFLLVLRFSPTVLHALYCWLTTLNWPHGGVRESFCECERLWSQPPQWSTLEKWINTKL